MKHYRVNKLAQPGGEIVKRKDLLASSDKQAIDQSSGRCRLSGLRRLAGRAEDRLHKVTVRRWGGW
jgi:hypothetical protein